MSFPPGDPLGLVGSVALFFPSRVVIVSDARAAFTYRPHLSPELFRQQGKRASFICSKPLKPCLKQKKRIRVSTFFFKVLLFILLFKKTRRDDRTSVGPKEKGSIMVTVWVARLSAPGHQEQQHPLGG